MMSDNELAELAADIKANGLIHAIVVDKNGVLIDGRNRLRACELASVEPVFVMQPFLSRVVDIARAHSVAYPHLVIDILDH